MAYSEPRIDNPATPVAASWNTAIAREAKPPVSDCDAGQSFQTYEIKSASDRAISMIFRRWEYCQGDAHGRHETKASNLALSPRPQPISLDGLFISGTNWRQFLTD
ncbi:MAG TPA: hypothetical protein VHX39_03900, partial [Acetobacteraceae bacterium]|nr:hypothetical protein [Acetobacteraceae bacterium]